MRIVAGRFKGKRLSAPEGRDAVRPTADRTRENAFNVLMHRFQGRGFQLMGARVVDAFAGTGALGLEALSRGAGHVTFIENGRDALGALKANIRTCGAEGETDLVTGDATRPPRAVAPCDLVLMDPPYHEGVLEPSLTALASAGWLKPGALVVAEHLFNIDIAAPPGFEVVDARRYGKAEVTFLVWNG